MYKIDKEGGEGGWGVQKSFTRTDPLSVYSSATPFIFINFYICLEVFISFGFVKSKKRITGERHKWTSIILTNLLKSSYSFDNKK